MRIKDARSYLLMVMPKSGTLQIVELLDTSGNTVKKIIIEGSGSARVSVPVGLTAIYSSVDDQKPKLYVNGVEKTAAVLKATFPMSGYLPAEHPRVGDIVVFEHP